MCRHGRACAFVTHACTCNGALPTSPRLCGTQVAFQLYEDAPQELRSRLWMAVLEHPELCKEYQAGLARHCWRGARCRRPLRYSSGCIPLLACCRRWQQHCSIRGIRWMAAQRGVMAALQHQQQNRQQEQQGYQQCSKGS